jgi:hypothetical protein
MKQAGQKIKHRAAVPMLQGELGQSQPIPDIEFDLLPRPVHKMRAYPITEFLIDTGRPETYERARSEWPGLA